MRKIYEIATEIRKDWKKVNYAAEPYLAAMDGLVTVEEKYGFDSGASVIRYFLGNAQSWRGEVAKRIKIELNEMIKDKY